MPRGRKKVVNKQKPVEKSAEDYEQFLIDKISKCQRISSELKENRVWQEIREDFEQTSKGLDLAWAFEDSSTPRFKSMQVAKMAATTFMNLQANYEHDLKLAKDQLEKFRNPHTEIKKDFDEEGVDTSTSSISQTLNATAYHGRT